tara:strand:+ start:177 stop:602 length:426 start_codon:yes stop_codon:yes gene_type:complete
MEMKLFGFKFRPFIVVSCIIIGAIIGCFVICSCSKITLKDVKEGFTDFGASTGYNMSDGVKGSFGNRKLPGAAPNLEANMGPKLPLAPGEMFFFADNEFKPECCVPPFSSVSSADGCACVTKEQVDYINMRGGNRSHSEVF